MLERGVDDRGEASWSSLPWQFRKPSRAGGVARRWGAGVTLWLRRVHNHALVTSDPLGGIADKTGRDWERA